MGFKISENQDLNNLPVSLGWFSGYGAEYWCGSVGRQSTSGTVGACLWRKNRATVQCMTDEQLLATVFGGKWEKLADLAAAVSMAIPGETSAAMGIAAVAIALGTALDMAPQPKTQVVLDLEKAIQNFLLEYAKYLQHKRAMVG